jgi:uncharacterized protein (TIGR02246 family)
MNARTIVAACMLVVVAVCLAAAPAPSPSPADDIAAIKKNTKDFEAAWNRHDAKALAALWAKDGDLIDPAGVTSVGREAVEKFFTEQYAGGSGGGAGKLAKVTYSNKKDSVRLVSADVAIEDWEVVLTGLIAEDGKAMGPHFHRVVIVSMREGGSWRIAAARPGLPTPVKDAAAPAEKHPEQKK